MGAIWEDLDAPFREVTELSPDATIVFVGGTLAYANPAAVKLLAAPSREALLGKASREVLHPDTLPLVEKNAARLMNGEVSSTREEERWVRLDGVIITVEVVATRATFFSGKAFLVFLRDVSDRKEAELRRRLERVAQARSAAAQERERWLRGLIDLLPNIVFVRDARGTFLLANRQCVELFGRPAEELLGRTPTDLGLEHLSVFSDFERVLGSTTPVVLREREVRTPSGRTYFVEGVKFRLPIDNDSFVVLTALTDLTQRKQLEAELLHAQRLEGVGRLAGGIAHDFNNLLGAVLVYAQTVRKSFYKDDERYEDMLEIEAAAKRGAELTQQLLTFARRQLVMPVEFDAGLHVRSLRGILERILGEQIHLTIEVEEGCFVFADPGQLEQVLVALTSNARDAIPDEGAVSVRVCHAHFDGETALSHEGLRAGSYVEVRVSDDGSGLSDEARQHLFEPFFTTKEVGRGTGLGLATCYGIARHADGSIWAEAREGGGTTFVFCVPVVRHPTRASYVPVPSQG